MHLRHQTDRRRSTVIVRILEFMNHLVTSDAATAPPTFWSPGAMDIVLRAALVPSSLGFDWCDVMVVENLPKESGALLNAMSHRLPPAIRAVLEHAIVALLAQREADLLSQVPRLPEERSEQVTLVSALAAGS